MEDILKVHYVAIFHGRMLNQLNLHLNERVHVYYVLGALFNYHKFPYQQKTQTPGKVHE